jgi:hypothetical protein
MAPEAPEATLSDVKPTGESSELSRLATLH